jgi:hypothetical protein
MYFIEEETAQEGAARRKVMGDLTQGIVWGFNFLTDCQLRKVVIKH